MAISYNTGATGDSGGATALTCTVTIPAGVLAGDVMLLSACGFDGASATTITVSSTGTAFTQITQNQTGGVAPATLYSNAGIWYAVAGAADAGATITLQMSDSTHVFWSATLADYTGASNSAPVDVSGGAKLSGASGTVGDSLACPAETTNTANDWAVYFFGGGTNSSTLTEPSGPTSREKHISAAGIASDICDSNGSVGAGGTGIGGASYAYATGAGTVWLATFTVGLSPAVSAAVPAPVAQNAQPGQTWQRAFQHPQQPATLWIPNGSAPATVAATGILNDTGVKNATGSSAVSGTGVLADTGIKNAANSSDATGTGTLADTGTHAGSGTGTATGTGSLTPSGSGGDTPVLPLTAQAGQTWRRQFQHHQQVLPYVPNAAAAATVTATGSLANTGTKATTGSSAITGTGTLADTGTRAATGSSAVTGTGVLADTGTKGTSAASAVSGTGSLADTGTKDTSGTSTVTGTGSLTGTGTIPVPLPAVAAAPGQTWRRQFRHPQLVLPQPASAAAPAAIGGTGSLASAGGKNATGSSTVSGTGSLNDTGEKGASSSPVLTGTGSLAPAGSGADTPVLPLRAQPGQTWQRAFQHPQQPAPAAIPPAPAVTGSATVTGTGVLADTATKNAAGSSTVTGTGTLADTGVKNAAAPGVITATGVLAPAGSGGDTPVLPLTAQAGQTWKRAFQHPQQVLPYVPNTSGSSAITGTGAMSAGAPLPPAPVIPPGTVTITPAGPNATTVAIVAAGPDAAGVTITQF